MSKLLSLYTNLKKQDNETFYLFKVGLFYNFINDDATSMSCLLHLKLTTLSSSIIKCGFPCNSFDKYMRTLMTLPYKVKVIDSLENNTMFDIKNFEKNKQVKNFIFKIASINIDNVSVTEAYTLLDELQKEAISIKIDFS